MGARLARGYREMSIELPRASNESMVVSESEPQAAIAAIKRLVDVPPDTAPADGAVYAAVVNARVPEHTFIQKLTIGEYATYGEAETAAEAARSHGFYAFVAARLRGDLLLSKGVTPPAEHSYVHFTTYRWVINRGNGRAALISYGGPNGRHMADTQTIRHVTEGDRCSERAAFTPKGRGVYTGASWVTLPEEAVEYLAGTQ